MIRYLFVDFPVDIMLTKSGTLLLCMHMCMVAAEQFSFLQGVEVDRPWSTGIMRNNSTQLNSTGHVTLMAKRDQKGEKKATAYQYPLSLI